MQVVFFCACKKYETMLQSLLFSSLWNWWSDACCHCCGHTVVNRTFPCMHTRSTFPYAILAVWRLGTRWKGFETKGHVSCVLSVAALLHCRTLCMQTHWLCWVKLCYNIKGLYNRYIQPNCLRCSPNFFFLQHFPNHHFSVCEIMTFRYNCWWINCSNQTLIFWLKANRMACSCILVAVLLLTLSLWLSGTFRTGCAC